MSNNKQNNKNKNSKKQQNVEENELDVPKKIVLDGVITDALPGTLFEVKTTLNTTVLCTLSGKLRQFKIRLLPGDNVRVEVSPYDLTHGRIAWRYTGKEKDNQDC
jgi:translation initiation factor IF-1